MPGCSAQATQQLDGTGNRVDGGGETSDANGGLLGFNAGQPVAQLGLVNSSRNNRATGGISTSEGLSGSDIVRILLVCVVGAVAILLMVFEYRNRRRGRCRYPTKGNGGSSWYSFWSPATRSHGFPQRSGVSAEFSEGGGGGGGLPGTIDP